MEPNQKGKNKMYHNKDLEKDDFVFNNWKKGLSQTHISNRKNKLQYEILN